MAKLAFYFDATQCTGCKACQVACKDKWDLPVGVTWRRVAEYSGGNWVRQIDGTYDQSVFVYYTSIACNHCDNPLCKEVCPTQAIEQRDDGIIEINEDKCIGCRYCEWACPYGAPQFNEDEGVMTKCNFEELRAKFGDLAEIAPLPDASITKPNLVIKPHRYAQAVDANNGQLANPKEV